MIKQQEVAILYPSLLEAQDDEYSSQSRNRIQSSVSSVTELLQDAADSVGHKVSLATMPLFYNKKGELEVPGPKRKRSIRSADVTVVFDPSDSVLQFALGTVHHPVRRTLMVQTEKDDNDERLNTLQYFRVPIINSQTINRVFLLFLSPNADQAAEDYTKNINIVSRALRYPDV